MPSETTARIGTTKNDLGIAASGEGVTERAARSVDSSVSCKTALTASYAAGRHRPPERAPVLIVLVL